MWISILSTYMSGTHRDQKSALDPLELELRAVMRFSEWNPSPWEEPSVLVTTKSSLQSE